MKHGVTAAILTCKDEPVDQILVTLQSLAEQSRPFSRIEVVDDGSVIPVNLPRVYANVELHRNEPNQGISVSRNEAACRSQAEFVLFINSGIHLPPLWHEEVHSFMSLKPEAASCTTRVVSAKKDNLVTRWRFRFMENPHTRTRGARRVPWITGHVQLMRFAAFKDVGGFDPSLRTCLEDGDISTRLCEAGYELWQVDGPDALCNQDNTLNLMARKCIRYRGWSTSTQPYPGKDLKPLDLELAIKDQRSFLFSRLQRNLPMGRFRLALLDFIIFRKTVQLIRDAWNREETR